MSTRRLYYDDSFQREFTAQLVSCERAVHGSSQAWRVVLDSTALYPTSGGQPHDIGKLNSANVLDVVDEEEEIIHIADQCLKPGTVQGCGGTHVKSTAQIGVVLVRRCSKVRQDWRVEFVCGRRAARIARLDFVTLRRVAAALSCAPDDAAAAAERAIIERDANFKASRAIQLRLAEAEATLALQAAPAERNALRVFTRLFQED